MVKKEEEGLDVPDTVGVLGRALLLAVVAIGVDCPEEEGEPAFFWNKGFDSSSFCHVCLDQVEGRARELPLLLLLLSLLLFSGVALVAAMSVVAEKRDNKRRGKGE